MTDVLIRDIPEDVLASIDVKAKRLGISRQEFLRRMVVSASRPGTPVTEEDLRRTSSVFADLEDDEAMKGAWE